MFHEALGFEAYSQIFVALVLLAIAGLTLRASPKRGANQIFAFFLTLVAANFTANFAADVLTDEGDHRATSAAMVFLILDPAVLFYFASIFPARRAWTRRPGLALAVLAAPLALYVYIPWWSSASSVPAVNPHRVVLIGYLAAAYLGSMVLIVAGWIDEKNPRRRELLRILVVAFGAAILPRVGNITSDFGFGTTWASFLITFLAFGAVFGLALLLNRNRRTETLRVAGWTGAVVALVVATWIPRLYTTVTPISSFTASYTYRWFIFAGLVSYAILRYQVFDIDLRVKRGVSGGVAVGALLMVFLTLRFIADHGLGVPAPLAEVFGLVGAAIAIAPVLKVSQGTARILLPQARTSETFLRQRKLEVYGAALSIALEGGRNLDGDEELVALRERLRLSTQDHIELATLTEAEHQVTRPRRFASIRKGTVLRGRYQIGDQLGAGVHGRTYLAEDRQAGGTVVVKELRPEWQTNDEARARFLREAQLLGSLESSYVVRVLNVFEVGALPYLVLEWVSGGGLDRRMDGRPMRPQEATKIVADILRGLDAIHEAGIIHRDIKPSNVLLGREGQAKIGDLGVAHVERQDASTILTVSGSHPGTLQYMSPEQARGETIDERSDLYSVAAILYELLAGRPAVEFPAASDFNMRRTLQDARPRLPLRGVPTQLNAALARGLAFKPEDRYSSALEFLREISSRSPNGTSVPSRADTAATLSH